MMLFREGSQVYVYEEGWSSSAVAMLDDEGIERVKGRDVETSLGYRAGSVGVTHSDARPCPHGPNLISSPTPLFL